MKEQPVSFRSFAWRSFLAALMMATTGPVAGAAGLLRVGGGAVSSSSSAANTNSAVTAAQAAAIAQRSQASLLRSTTVQQSLQAMQAAARAAAQAAASNVPDGLGLGGLQVANGVPANLNNVQPSENAALWQGAQLPTQTTGTNGKTDVNIKQTAQQALLTWQTFNIGKNTTLTYDQSAGGSNTSQWIVFNKINDPSGNPSQILGSIKATGQVYVINQNGIIFGGSSQVNTHTLVASSLPINDNLVSRGLLNNPDTQFLFTALPQSAGSKGPTDAFAPPSPLTIDGHQGDVVVEAGAQLSSPTNSDKTGGRIALIGANVTNAGSISTPDGQAILAAGLQVGFTAHDSSDPSLRGLDVFVGNVGAYAGSVTNSGVIDAPRASVILTGKTIAQNGAVTSTTSASLNGRIDLLADYNAVGTSGYVGSEIPVFFRGTTGNVAFGSDSITQILPEWNSTERVVGTALALPSQINVSARNIYLAPQALIFAPGANLSLNAGSWIINGTPRNQFVFTDGQIYLADNASIDVGGSTDVPASVTDNFISVQLRGAELANSPLQRDGALRGQTVQIDIRQTGTLNGKAWVGTPLADTSGYVALVDHTVGQLTTNGGTVNLNAGGSLIMQSGSTINVSGGTTNYQGGTVATTKVLSGGHIYDISQAAPDQVYSGIYTDGGGAYEAGYIQGANAGSINITAPAMALDGGFYGNTVAGPRQRTITPVAGGLRLVFQNQYTIDSLTYLADSPTPLAITFKKDATLAAADAFTLDASGVAPALRVDRAAEVILSPGLFSANGFGNVSIDNSDGNITVPIGSALNLQPRGALSFSAANIFIDDSITSSGGSLSFTAANISLKTRSDLSTQADPATPAPAVDRGRFVLGTGVKLSAAGLIVNDLNTSPSANTRPLATAGGSILITGYDVAFGASTILDVSGGVAISAANKYSYGAGGSLSIKAGQDANLKQVVGGQLSLDYTQTTLMGYSGGKGGALTVQAPSIQVGGASLLDGNILEETFWINPIDVSGGLLADDFFTSGGFTSFNLIGLGLKASSPGQFVPGVRIASGTKIAPMASSWIVNSDASTVGGFSLASVLKPSGIRTAANITFNASGVLDNFDRSNPHVIRGDLFVGEGASIITDPSGSITLKGETVNLLGKLIAPGGSISVAGGNDSNGLFSLSGVPAPTVLLGSESMISTAGTTVLTPDATGHGYRTGSVLGGGAVSVSGNIVALGGSIIDVSGASGILDLSPIYTGGEGGVGNALPVATRVNSAGGTISIAGKQELFLDSDLIGAGGSVAAIAGERGGSPAAGGSLYVTSGLYVPPTSVVPTTPLDVTMVITQSGPVLPSYADGQGAIGQPVLTSFGIAATGHGYVAADTLNSGGFDTLTLGGTVRFEGDVDLTANSCIRLASAGVISGNGAITLSAPSVLIGSYLVPPSLPGEVISTFQVAGASYYFPPTYGSGSLTISATSLIDVGNLSLQGIGGVIMDVSSGDLRGSGTFDMAGDLLIAAGQIYPTAATPFTISVSDYQDGVTVGGSITTYKGDDRSLPFSAGGTLNLYASTINQGGTLRAPIGTINLGWNGTGTAPVDPITGQAVAAASKITLTSDSITSVSALDPITGKGVTLPYGISSDGTSWIDPSGKDITTSGVPAKKINIFGQSVTTETGATVDIDGGGDLYAYRWVSGTGGTSDILASSGSFAIIPGYQADYAAISTYNNSAAAVANLGSDNGYTNLGLSAGDKIYLDASIGLPAGVYTLLPARYALLPGAFLVTPKSGAPTAASVVQPDGASTVAGYRFNDSLDITSGIGPLRSSFEVASRPVVRTRAQYDDYSANTFLRNSAINNNAAVPRLPVDAGQLVFSAIQAMSLEGVINTRAFTGGLGGLIDINSPVDIVIGGPTSTSSFGQLLLDASQLSTYEGASILIGGTSSSGQQGTIVTVGTNNLTVDNAGSPLSGAGVILVAKQNLTLADGADIRQTGSLVGSTGTLFLGSSETIGSGDGALLRVSSDAAAAISRSGVSVNSTAALTLGSGVNISGGSALILDSTGTTNLDSTAIFGGQAVTLNSGRISLQLSDPGTLQSSPGLVLTGAALDLIQTSAHSLSLLSYSSIDVYGTGQIGTANFSSLSLRAPSIRGFNTAGGQVNFVAQTILLDGGVGGSSPIATGVSSGTLAFSATKTLTLGAGQMDVGQYAQLLLSAANGVSVAGSGGITTSDNLELSTPVLTAATAASQQITAGGALTLSTPASVGTTTVVGGLGANLTLVGTSVVLDNKISLPSGTLTLHATTGDVVIGGNAASLIDVSGTAKVFNDQTRFTNGGTINLIADAGDVTIASGSTLSAAAQAGGGNAGMLFVSVPTGVFTLDGALLDQAGTSGQGGVFSLDAHSLTDGSLAALNASLNTAGFTQEQNFRFRTGDVLVDGTATTRNFTLSADQGSITVTGKIDASGATGGSIKLSTGGDLVLETGSQLTVAAQNFDNAGKGGSVSLEAGSELNGVIDTTAVLDLKTGALIDLSVASQTSASAASGKFSGALHLRAPQNVSANDLQMNALNATILNASSVVVEGYKLFDLTASGGAITAATQDDVKTGCAIYGGNADAIAGRLLAENATLASVLHVQPGTEIINRNGDLTLGTSWDLSSLRFGSGVDAAILGSGEPGNLTLRAGGNLNFSYDATAKKFASLSDGFGTNIAYNAPLLAPGVRSWSYTLVAGADLGASMRTAVKSLGQLGVDSGSIQVGLGSPSLPLGGSVDALRSTFLEGNSNTPSFYQTIRTGTGDIEIAAGRDVRLLNNLASIYTAGTQAASIGNFDTPNTSYRRTSELGSIQSPYAAYYSLAGGNIAIFAQNDIGHFLQQGSLIADSSAELPTNWLYRRGQVDPMTGQFVAPTGLSGAPSQISSTTWWVDFSNFFEGVGALGGGNVSLKAGRDVANVDAVAPTNARMPKGTPDASALFELGGGDVTVQAGRNIDGGVYYVERGIGTLSAAGDITTNSTRAAVKRTEIKTDVATWLPTTLFLGKGAFSVSAGGDLLLGSVANPFLLPQGINNSYFNKSYFTTYAADDAVSVNSFTGSVTLKSDPNDTTGSLANWFANVLYNDFPIKGRSAETYAGYNQPWLRLAENKTSQFDTLAALLPGILNATAFSGNVNLIGKLTLAPSRIGTVGLYAASSINGLQPNGLNNPSQAPSSANLRIWSTATINVSDASPASLPGVATPLSLPIASSATPSTLMTSLNALFNESGSTEGYYGVLQNQQTLHDPNRLHLDDNQPLRLYAGSGDISGLTLYAPKSTRVIAGQDITDVALYLQNLSVNDNSVVSAGRDLTAYDSTSALRAQAIIAGNQLYTTSSTTPGPGIGNPTAGDIQIGGPGTLIVTAGRNLDLGSSVVTPDGTALGVTSIGNTRNPSLPSIGASITIAAGLGGSQTPDYQAFDAQFLNPASAGAYAGSYLPDLGVLLGLSSSATNDQIWATFTQLPQEKQDGLSRALFNIVLRDAGRDHNDSGSAGFGNYAAGYAAIDALFPGSKDWTGGLSLSSREISTTNGGDISIFSPGGGISLGTDQPKNSGTPPGIITERGGSISIFARDSVDIGAQRIFTLRGGDVMIWSSTGNIAAGFSSKTVQSAAPTRVLIDPQSGDVKTDLAGLATGGGIGVLATVAGVEPGNVDLIAPVGSIDAGDAGIRSSGNLNIAALQVLNAGNIQTGGTSTGTPAASSAPVSAPSSTSTSEAANSASDLAQSSRDGGRNGGNGDNVMPSLISVEVLGYGGSDPSPSDSDQKKEDKDKKDEAKADDGTSPGQLTKQDSSLDGQRTALSARSLGKG